MTALLHSELWKMRTTRTNLGLLLGLVGLVLLGVLVGILTSDDSALAVKVNQAELLAGATAGTAFATLVGVLSVTSEFRHGTIRATFVVCPVRRRVIAAKVLASLLLGICFGLLAEALAFGAAVGALEARGAELLLDSGDVIQMFVGGAGMAALWAALGVGFGAIVRHQVPAVLALLFWALVVESLLIQFTPGLARYLPGPAGTAMTGDTDGDGAMQLLSWPAGAAVLAAYAAVAVAAGAAVIARRDVK
jgi:ABC-2 type transport system permease protein